MMMTGLQKRTDHGPDKPPNTASSKHEKHHGPDNPKQQGLHLAQTTESQQNGTSTSNEHQPRLTP
jgi:hypothetical protein